MRTSLGTLMVCPIFKISFYSHRFCCCFFFFQSLQLKALACSKGSKAFQFAFVSTCDAPNLLFGFTAYWPNSSELELPILRADTIRTTEVTTKVTVSRSWADLLHTRTHVQEFSTAIIVYLLRMSLQAKAHKLIHSYIFCQNFLLSKWWKVTTGNYLFSFYWCSQK